MVFNINPLNGPAYLSLPRPETPWLVHSLIPRDGMFLISSPPKQGKSTALLQMAAAISNPTNLHFLGLPILAHGPVGYLQLDTPSGLWVSEYVIPMANAGLDFANVFFEDRDTMPKGIYPFNILAADHADWLRSWVNSFNPSVVIVDTYRKIFRGEEKDSHVVDSVLSNLYKALTPSAIVLVHHERKLSLSDHQTPEEDQLVSDRARGSTNLPATADVICSLSRKVWKIQGRGGDMTLKVSRDPDTKLLTLKSLPTHLINKILSDPNTKSLRAKAQLLADETGLSFDAAHYRLREVSNSL